MSVFVALVIGVIRPNNKGKGLTVAAGCFLASVIIITSNIENDASMERFEEGGSSSSYWSMRYINLGIKTFYSPFSVVFLIRLLKILSKGLIH